MADMPSMAQVLQRDGGLPFQPPMPDPRVSGRIDVSGLNPQEPKQPAGVMEAIELLASVAPWALAGGAAVGGISAARALARAPSTFAGARGPVSGAGAVAGDVARMGGLGAANGAISGGAIDALGAWQRSGRMDDQMPPMPQYPKQAPSY